ncbi:alpha-galactosidase [Enterococcus sp. LJL90]
MSNHQTLIEYLPETKQFHLRNQLISYIFKISKDGKLLHLHYGKQVPMDRNYSYLIELQHRPMTTYRNEGDLLYSLEHVQQELPEYGATDFRHPAIQIKQANGSLISDFIFKEYQILKGKSKLKDLPATYVEQEAEASTLVITLVDSLTHVEVKLLFTIFKDYPVITRSQKIVNKGTEKVALEKLDSLSLDFSDSDYEWLQLSGAWGRERFIKERRLEQGITSVESTRGVSSHQHNPFVALKRRETNESSGEAIGVSLIYSGNFLIQAEVDTWDVTRLQVGINPFGFEWQLMPQSEFQSPEAVLVYSSQGLNGMSQAFHQLFRNRLARGEWRDRERPVLLNNWEATYFDFNEEKLVAIAEKAKAVDIDLFVLDDGWFGERNDDHGGLGDWFVNRERLPQGIGSLSEKIRQLGLKFGLWFEPEMVNKASDLYRNHPDWVIQTPERALQHGRNQYVLNYANDQVVENIFEQMSKIIEESKLDYIKWDMNRPLTDVYALNLSDNQQGEVFHRFVLGVYKLYEMLTTKYPNVLFESCSSGGGRFDAGMLYYAPQAWTSDDSDAIERLKIQYGTSLLYPLSSMGAHVSITPNHQTNRKTPLHTRGNVAFFGAFGYELDLNRLSEKELAEVKEQIKFYKKYQKLLHNGMFYRLSSPFSDNQNQVSWMVVDQDQEKAVLAVYKILNEVNKSYDRIILHGLKENFLYEINGKEYSGSELMNIGFLTSDSSSGQINQQNNLPETYDFDSRIWVLTKKGEI